jgi:ubiquinone/menaquinone biosynthesis C-methylase UbiE
MSEESDLYSSKYYESVTYRGLVGLFAKMNHISLEHKPYRKNGDVTKKSRILEVGAGHGQHYKYVKDDYKNYLMTDMRPTLLRDLVIDNPRIKTEAKSVNAEELPYRDNEFDRLIATCLLIHLRDPEKALREWKRDVRPGGTISIYIPCESGLLLRIAQALSTRRRQKKLGINAKYLHHQEHPYTYPFLISILKNIFGANLTIRKFPFILGSFDLNLWSVVTITNVKSFPSSTN